MGDKPFRTDFGWPAYYTPTIMDGPVIRWRKGRQEVSASRNAMCIDAQCSVYDDDYQLIDIVWNVHKQLAAASGPFDARNPTVLDFGSDTMTWDQVAGKAGG